MYEYLIVKIKIIEFYIKKSLDYGLISFKKFINIGEYLLELIKMINTWIKMKRKNKLYNSITDIRNIISMYNTKVYNKKSKNKSYSTSYDEILYHRDA